MGFHSFDDNVYPVVLLGTQTTTATSAYVNPFANFERVFFLLHARTTGTTLDMKVVQGTDSSGSDSKDVTDSASTVLDITQLVAANDGIAVGLDCGPGVLDQANSFTHLAVTVTADGSCTWDVIAFYYRPRFGGSQSHDSTYLVANAARLYARGLTVTQG